ncbi:hypothetical protein GYB22_05465 [bacterium]|nr:hypothetical protein [bacterium]
MQLCKAMKSLRICENGHEYYKSSDCPVCPICEQSKDGVDFMKKLSKPAQRALLNANINTLQELSLWTAKELLDLHGFGPSSIPKLELELKQVGLKFKE